MDLVIIPPDCLVSKVFLQVSFWLKFLLRACLVEKNKMSGLFHDGFFPLLLLITYFSGLLGEPWMNTWWQKTSKNVGVSAVPLPGISSHICTYWAASDSSVFMQGFLTSSHGFHGLCPWNSNLVNCDSLSTYLLLWGQKLALWISLLWELSIDLSSIFSF